MELKIPGLHNVVNALAVVALGRLLGIEVKKIQEALAAFTGAKRRFEIQGEVDGILVVEDYAHHPAEIRSTLQAARTWKDRRIRCVFQPHRYSRTRHLFDPFCQALALADQVALVPIYAASEEPLEGIVSDRLVQGIQAAGGRAAFFQGPEELFARWTADAKTGDLFLFMGAGSIGGWAGRFLKALREKRGA
jgi:UDP-N-acetylmuramate--alanine ligase